MDAQSLRSPTRDSFGTPPWESREKLSFRCSPCGELQSEPLAGREATAPSIIRIVQIVQRGEEMPPNGGIVLPENVQVQPFLSKRKLNARLDGGVFGGAVRSNGLRSGHTDLDRGNLGLRKDLIKRVEAVEVPSAPLR